MSGSRAENLSARDALFIWRNSTGVDDSLCMQMFWEMIIKNLCLIEYADICFEILIVTLSVTKMYIAMSESILLFYNMIQYLIPRV